jgi:N-acetyl-anhydromuramyl-L-alanine amidase AmpD
VKFIQARNYTRVTGAPRRIDVIVIHTMESPEKPDTAEAVAAWFAGSNAPQASAHYCVDSNSVVQGVLDKDVAWAAPGANHNGIQIEHAGRAAQTAKDWRDGYSVKELAVSAETTRGLVRKYNIPIRWLSPNDLRAGRRGITSHANVSAAFRKSNHTDPGPNFPVTAYLALVAKRTNPVKKVIRFVIKRRKFTNSGLPTTMTTVEPAGTAGGTPVK